MPGIQGDRNARDNCQGSRDTGSREHCQCNPRQLPGITRQGQRHCQGSRDTAAWGIDSTADTARDRTLPGTLSARTRPGTLCQGIQARTPAFPVPAEIMDPYVPPEGDARLTSLSKDGVKQQMQKLRQTAASQLALRKIKDHDPDFSTKTFPEKAQEIFIEAHNSLANFNKQKLHSLVTERCYPVSVQNFGVGPSCCPRVLQPHPTWIFCVFGQTLAIYDRFGRLMYGGEEVPKDVLEYVVFERYLVNPYGAWRMHGKIVPEWAPPKEPIVRTVLIPGPALDPSQQHEEAK
uniref:Large ribosomal subunit protein mL45 n=1 Tax=Malurus cyaneus samueli TaxID=2593467 RepID=A0A8C5TIV4_9PASS